MFSLGIYIFLIALVYVPLLICGNGVSEARKENKSINFMIGGSLFAIIIEAITIPWISDIFLNSNRFNRIVFCIYLSGNLFANLRFIQKKIDGSISDEICRFLKNMWVCCVIIYTVLLGYCFYNMNYIVIIFAVVFYVAYHCCALGFDFFFKEGSLKEWEEAKYELLPLRQISVGNHREWLRKREIKLRRQTLLFAAVYQAVFIVFILVAAKRITVLAVFIIFMLYSLTLGSLLLRWNKRLKDIESREIDGVYKGRGLIETSSPFRVKYRDAEGEFQSRCVEKPQRKKYKQGTLVDIVMENGEIVLAEKNLPE